MVDQDKLFQDLKNYGIEFFTGVPDSLLNDFCLFLVNNLDNRHHVMAANEGNAIGIAAGYNLATNKVPVVYMQNSGIGNATNPILSLAHESVYGIPMILLIGWRGDPSIKDHAQHKKQGELTPILMNDMDIPYKILDSEETVAKKFKWALETAQKNSAPVALIAKKAILTEKVKKQIYAKSDLPNREEAIASVVELLGPEAVYLATTGRATRELHEVLKSKNWDKTAEFLNVGAMGHLSSVALGIAVAKPEKQIVIFDGDASSIMHMGALATAGRYNPENILHIVLNNGANESVGGQPSPGHLINLSAIAKACGYLSCGKPITSESEFKDFIKENPSGLRFVDFHVRQGIRSDMPKLDIDHKAQKSKLMSLLQPYI